MWHNLRGNPDTCPISAGIAENFNGYWYFKILIFDYSQYIDIIFMYMIRKAIKML